MVDLKNSFQNLRLRNLKLYLCCCKNIFVKDFPFKKFVPSFILCQGKSLRKFEESLGNFLKLFYFSFKTVSQGHLKEIKIDNK